jgi:hypothetical protein
MRRARITLQREPKLLLGLHSIDNVNDYIRLVDSYVDDILISDYSKQLIYLYMFVGNLEQKLNLAGYEYTKVRSVLTKRLE